MSDFQTFEAIKRSYTQETSASAKQYLALEAQVDRDRKTNSPTLKKDEHNLALFDLAIADVHATAGDGDAAHILYAEAQKLMKSGKIHGLDELSRSVGRKIP